MVSYRTTGFAAHEWKNLTYDEIRISSIGENSMDIETGIFTAPLTGTYQFIIQASHASPFFHTFSHLTCNQILSLIMCLL